jgi:hypothetical protein
VADRIAGDRIAIFPSVSTSRRKMTVRVVPLQSRAAGNAIVSGTAAERLALVADLSAMSWELTGKPLPRYTRATMPVVLTTLQAQGASDVAR